MQWRRIIKKTAREQEESSRRDAKIMFFVERRRTQKKIKNIFFLFTKKVKRENNIHSFFSFSWIFFQILSSKGGFSLKKKCSSPFLFFWSILFKFSSSIHFSTRNEHKYSKNIENTWYCGEEENPLNQVSLAFFCNCKMNSWSKMKNWRNKNSMTQSIFLCCFGWRRRGNG